jgi:hypothetical protein
MANMDKKTKPKDTNYWPKVAKTQFRTDRLGRELVGHPDSAKYDSDTGGGGAREPSGQITRKP